MSLQVIYVTAVQVGTNLFLRLSRSYCEVDVDPDHATMIAWVLDDRGTGARFVQDSDKKGEAFAWNDAPNLPQGVFDMKATVPEGDLIWLFDKHKYQGPQTSNAYTLRVLWNNQVWETPHGPVHSTDWRTKDPVIINR